MKLIKHTNLLILFFFFHEFIFLKTNQYHNYSFGISGAVVRINGNVCPIVNQTHTQIICTSPPGQGVGVIVDVVVGGQNCSDQTGIYSYDPPSLTSLTPTFGNTQGGTSLQLTGNNFGTNASVTIGGVVCPITAQNHVSITCTLPAGQGRVLEVRVTVASQVSLKYRNK